LLNHSLERSLRLVVTPVIGLFMVPPALHTCLRTVQHYNVAQFCMSRFPAQCQW
jgi:hypothetical protein